jgi:molybdopterin molybdotransferase
VKGRKLSVAVDPLQRPKSFIHKRGSEIAEGAVILEKGVIVSSDHQVLLAGTGYNTVRVVKRPRVSFFCTGSELLTDTTVHKQAGQRFSGNSHLLSGLINRYGGELVEQETVVDDSKQVVALMDRMAKNSCDILISTGGMGPGKFDLIEEAFARCGGEIIYRSLHMRPGKSTLFGRLGSTLFFGLPGPPPAVQLLFHELLRPAFCALQGVEQCSPQKIKAILTEELNLAKHGLLRLKSGVFSLHDGSCLVRPATRDEPSNCYIFCPPEKQFIPKNDMVKIHLTVSCLDSVLSS